MVCVWNFVRINWLVWIIIWSTSRSFIVRSRFVQDSVHLPVDCWSRHCKNKTWIIVVTRSKKKWLCQICLLYSVLFKLYLLLLISKSGFYKNFTLDLVDSIPTKSIKCVHHKYCRSGLTNQLCLIRFQKLSSRPISMQQETKQKPDPSSSSSSKT